MELGCRARPRAPAPRTPWKIEHGGIAFGTQPIGPQKKRILLGSALGTLPTTGGQLHVSQVARPSQGRPRLLPPASSRLRPRGLFFGPELRGWADPDSTGFARETTGPRAAVARGMALQHERHEITRKGQRWGAPRLRFSTRALPTAMPPHGRPALPEPRA